MSAFAMVQTGPGRLEPAELPLPRIGDGDTLIRLEACGLCGSDIEYFEGPEEFFTGKFAPVYPVIRGHEPVGVVEEIGDAAAVRRGLQVGDRVAVSPFIPCGICRFCYTGAGERCSGWGRAATYGSIPLSEEPGLWGGYASHLFAGPNTVLLPVPKHVGPELATLYNALGAGIRWGIDAPGTTIGSTVVVLGAGQRGLSAAIAARAAGASLVIVTGLASDRHKLDLALELGVDAAINVQEESVVERVHELTGGLGVDIAVDASAGAVQPILDAIDFVRRGGTIAIGGLKLKTIPNFPVDLVVRKTITMKGIRGVGPDAYRRAIDMIASEQYPLDRLRTHVLPLQDVERAIGILAGKEPDQHPINIVVTPPA